MRGEGNHKIPGSFAPENMEKTGAERVKYSLACQHEDAIPIKFVSYAQKCPTVLCTFAVALRKESVDRNNDDFSVESGEIVKQFDGVLDAEKVEKALHNSEPCTKWQVLDVQPKAENTLGIPREVFNAVAVAIDRPLSQQ